MNLQWASVTPKKHRHFWKPATAEVLAEGWLYVCLICGAGQDQALTRRGRNNRSRGNAIERWACHLLGIRRVGQFGGLEDGGSSEDHLVIQVKSGGAFQQSLLAKIRSVPVRSDQLRAWVTVSTPGAGRPREGVISFDLAEWAAWYGKGAPDAEEPQP
jgi:hypothetical protein